jgi:hypothetical protein
MLRPATVVVGAMLVGALAMIALLMGLFVPMHASGPKAASCGHLLDASYRHGPSRSGCAEPLRDRRIEVAVAAVVAGAAGVVGLAAGARAIASQA